MAFTISCTPLTVRPALHRTLRVSGRRPAPPTNSPSTHTTRLAILRAEPTDKSTSSTPTSTPAQAQGFGYSRLDILIIGGGLIGLGFGMYYGAQAFGIPPEVAGNYVQLIIFLGICIGWVSTYFYRVATKNMTYAQQLKDYEEAVMAKRLEEMPEADLDDLLSQIEREKEELQRRRSGKA